MPEDEKMVSAPVAEPADDQEEAEEEQTPENAPVEPEKPADE